MKKGVKNDYLCKFNMVDTIFTCFMLGLGKQFHNYAHTLM